jgi:hypothetical protein
MDLVIASLILETTLEDWQDGILSLLRVNHVRTDTERYVRGPRCSRRSGAS